MRLTRYFSDYRNIDKIEVSNVSGNREDIVHLCLAVLDKEIPCCRLLKNLIRGGYVSKRFGVARKFSPLFLERYYI